jgi:hypothetical protein
MALESKVERLALGLYPIPYTLIPWSTLMESKVERLALGLYPSTFEHPSRALEILTQRAIHAKTVNHDPGLAVTRTVNSEPWRF